MKKKLLAILLLATISIICAVLFAACNNGNNTQKDTYSIALSHGNTETPLVKINTTGNYDMNAIEKGSSITFSVELRNDYDPSTLKIFSNGKETALQLNADLSIDYIDNVTYRQIGTFMLDNITENINLTYQAKEQKIAIHFYTSIFEGTPTTEQTEVLNSFYIDGDPKPLSEYVDSEQPFYTTLSRILSTETKNGFAKNEGYLSVCGGEILNGAYIYDTFSLGEGMMKALLSKEGEPGNLFQDWATPEKNLFFINLQDYFVWRDPQTANQAYAKKMKELLFEYNAKKEKTFDDLLDFHYKFECIHPFQDGNGRIGRLLLLKECLKYNIVPFIIDEELKLFYYRGLKEWLNERGYLRDTCLMAQDKFKLYLDYFKVQY